MSSFNLHFLILPFVDVYFNLHFLILKLLSLEMYLYFVNRLHVEPPLILCMYAWIHVCLYACMHICIYASMHGCIYAYMHDCMHVSSFFTHVHWSWVGGWRVQRLWSIHFPDKQGRQVSLRPCAHPPKDIFRMYSY